MNTILVAVDLSEITPDVIEQAARLATGTASKLVVLHVGPAEADFAGQQLFRKVVDADEVAERLRPRLDELSALEKDLDARGIETDSLMVLGKPIETILDESRRVGAEMIVIGSHRRGAVARLLGSVSEGVLRGARCPMLIVPAVKD